MKTLPRLSGGTLLFASIAAFGALVYGQDKPSTTSDEIPIEKCDVLPVVRVHIDGTDMRFLLDTGATTILNLSSFTTGHSKNIEVTSWSGTAATSAREVRLPEFALGKHSLHDLRKRLELAVWK